MPNNDYQNNTFPRKIPRSRKQKRKVSCTSTEPYSGVRLKLYLLYWSWNGSTNTELQNLAEETNRLAVESATKLQNNHCYKYVCGKWNATESVRRGNTRNVVPESLVKFNAYVSVQ